MNFRSPMPARCLLHLASALAFLLQLAPFAHTAPGDVDSGFVSTVGDSVNAVAVQPDGKILIGGIFTYFLDSGSPTYRNHLARLQTDGSLDAAFDAQLNNNGFVRALAVQDDGKIVVGGVFESMGGVARQHLARLLPDGMLDTTFDVAVDGDVNALALQPDGSILVAGGFTQVAGQPRTNVARILPNGTLDAGFVVPIGGDINQPVEVVAVQEDGRILIGGYFASVRGQTRVNLARLNGDGTLDTAFDAGPIAGIYGNYDGAVQAVSVQSDGRILIGGFFRSVNGQTRHCVARLEASGALDGGFDPDVSNNFFDPYPNVRAVAVQANGGIVMGGHFNLVGGTLRQFCARLTPNGTLDPVFAPATYDVSDLALQADGRVLAAAGYIGAPPTRLGRLENDAATGSLTMAGTSQVQWLRGGTAPETQAVSFAVSTNGGLTWTPLGAGARIAGGWQKTGVSLPPTGLLRARARTASGSSGLVEMIVSFPDATTTQPPLLTLPYSGLTQKTGSTVTFNLPEAAQPGSVKLRYRNAGNLLVAELSLGAVGESAGTHSFALDPAMPTTAPLVASGGPIADGAYRVELAYRDALGNPEAVSAQALNVIIDTVTQAPVLTYPSAHATTGLAIMLDYTLPEKAQPGAVRLTFDDGITPRVWTLDDTEAGGGAHSFIVYPTDPTSSPKIAAAVPLPEGRYLVTLSYQDAGNAPATATATDFGFDYTALPPPLNSPAAGSTHGPGIAVQYSLPETAKPGTVTLTFVGAVITQVVLTDPQGPAGLRTFTLNALALDGSTAVAGVNGPTALPDGSYTVVLQYSDAYDNAAGTSAENVIIASAAYSQWKLANFNDLDAPDLGNADNDAYANLAEYGLVLSPAAFSTGPVGERPAYPEGDRLRIIFTRDPARNDVTIEAQAADDLAGPWATIASSVLGAATTGAGYYGGESAGPGLKTVEVRDVFNIGNPAHPHRFLRLQVSH